MLNSQFYHEVERGKHAETFRLDGHGFQVPVLALLSTTGAPSYNNDTFELYACFDQ